MCGFGLSLFLLESAHVWCPLLALLTIGDDDEYPGRNSSHPGAAFCAEALSVRLDGGPSMIAFLIELAAVASGSTIALGLALHRDGILFGRKG